MTQRIEDGSFVPPWVRREHHARFHFAAGFVKGRRVVDCACGDGTGTAVYASRDPGQIVAFDLARSAVRLASGRPSPGAVGFAAARADSLPLRDGVADVYIALETIEHLADDLAFLREAERVLRPGGLFICSTPNRTVTNPGRELHDRPLNPDHLREYSLDEFRELLERHFEWVEWRGQNPVAGRAVRVWTSLARRLPGPSVARLRQLAKLPFLLADSDARHEVQAPRPDVEYEYLVAVCRRRG